MRDPETIARLVLQSALAWEPEARLLGDVTAAEVAALAARTVMTCPACGSEAWVNIDCDTCLVCTALVAPCACITAHDRMICVGWCDPPVVCPGCYAVGEEPHLSWCIDEQRDEEYRHAIESGDYGDGRDEEEDC